MIARSFDAERANYLINHPDVRPFVGAPDAGDLDLTQVIAQPENWLLIGEHGGFLLTFSAPGVHEVHTFILKSGRGQTARQAAAETIAYARENGDRMLWTKVPHDLPHVAAFATHMGMSPTGMEVAMFGKPFAVLKMEL